MPLIDTGGLPSYQRLRSLGLTLLTAEEAGRQDIRELHIGFLNMMPDAAFQTTERQFLWLLGASNSIVQIVVHPFALPAQRRSTGITTYIQRHYESLDSVTARRLDGLIISGANPSAESLEKESFWAPLSSVIEWANEAVTSTLCSCLASHAFLYAQYNVRRRRSSTKTWGVLPHQTVRTDSPLTATINTHFEAPHSRWYDVPAQDLQEAGVEVLIETEGGGWFLAVSPDGAQTVFLQGHPEYEAVSLLKEYRRELELYVSDNSRGFPPLPTNAFDADGGRLAARLGLDFVRKPSEAFPEDVLLPHLRNVWRDTATHIFGNWLGMVYRMAVLADEPESPS